jgi:glutaredoxin 3
VKEFLKEAGVSFQDIDVSSDETARGEMVRKAGQMVVPIIEVNGDIIVGFKEGELREKLDL